MTKPTTPATPTTPSTPGAPAEPAKHWTVSGPPGAPAIVFVHGAMMGRSVWAPQLQRLSDRFRCIAVDQPGHGALRGERFTMDRAVRNVVEAIDREAGGRAVVVGLSLGGYVAMTVAGYSPERVCGLVIAGCTREPVGLSRLGFHAYSWGLRIVPERLVSAVALRWFRVRYGPEIAKAITAGGHFSAGGSRAVGHLANRRLRTQLLAYDGPVQAINGATDLVFVIGARRFLEGVRDLRYTVIPRAGHLSNVDAPDRFTAIVEEFIATLPA
ncbi:MAG TPA: alpha/beta fold hydrolase [Candidatus Binatia bacterium]|nr:alpha/beta fold hydrolase [Candidatus Binatia bacterium]